MGSIRIITVVDYDSSWPVQFEALRLRLAQALGSIEPTIQHVGSTSVPGLAAKPIIDIDVIVDSMDRVACAIERLGTLGYRHQGNLGVEGREAFASPSECYAHHLYVCVLGGAALHNHLTIRDRLRRHPDAAAAYGALKKRLAKRFATDAVKYNDGKTEFLVGLLRTERR